MRFRDSVIWITGASSGIGKKTAKQFHAEGAHIVFSARREGDLNRVVDKCVGPGDARRNVWLKRHSPALLSEITRRRGPERTSVPAEPLC